MKCNKINIHNTLSASYRFDSSYHLSDAISFRYLQQKLPYENVPIRDVVERVFLGNIFSRIFVKDKEYGVPYLAASDTVLANLDTNRYLSKKQSQDLNYLKIHKDWILITCSGTIGNVTFTNSKFEGRIATHDLIRVIPNDSKMLKGALYAYLASKFGYCQLTQSKFGGVVKHINADHVYDITIPLFPKTLQIKINDLIQESAKLREEASIMIETAKSILLNYCNADFRKDNFKTAVVKNIDILSSLQHRIDPPALINDGVITINKIKEIKKTIKLKDTGAKVFRPGIFKRCYVNNGYPYIKGSDIFNVNPFVRCSYLSRKNTPFVNEMLLHEGQILVTCAGSVGNIKLITKEYDDKEALGSQDIIRIETTNNLFTKEYLFIYLQLPFVYDYIQSMKYGSVIERVEPFHIESIPVVQPTVKISEEITSLVRRYMECTYKAFVEEETAIKEVEQEIESWNKK